MNGTSPQSISKLINGKIAIANKSNNTNSGYHYVGKHRPNTNSNHKLIDDVIFRMTCKMMDNAKGRRGSMMFVIIFT